MPTKYNLAIEFKSCDYTKFCIFNKRKSFKCKDSLQYCSFPIRDNPLCFCNEVDSCPRNYYVYSDDKRNIIFYSCSRCPHFIKGGTETRNKILEQLHNDRIYYQKDLDKLIKTLKITEESNSDIDKLIEYFGKIINSTSSRT